MSIRTRLVEYAEGDNDFAGMLAWNDVTAAPRPGILIAHTIAGRSDFEAGKARQLAELGYVAFALDVYGKGTQGSDLATNRSWMKALLADREELQRRLQGALQTLRAQPEVDARRTAAIGFCFGGLCALDIARTGADVAGVVSFHGLFSAPDNTAGNSISAKVLVLHGWDDPMATPDAVTALAAELTAMRADWQVHAYGNTMHAFTNPAANEPASGKDYNRSADERSWLAMKNFLAELFGKQEK